MAVNNNEVIHTLSDLQTGYQSHDLSKFIQDLQQEKQAHPQDMQQYIAACNQGLEAQNVLPGLQLEGLTKAEDRAIFKTGDGREVTVGADSVPRLLQPGEASAGPDTTSGATSASDTGAAASRSPEAQQYTVKPGDSLWRIARHTLGADVSERDVYKYVKEIAQSNGMHGINETIYADQKLNLPKHGQQADTSSDRPAAKQPEQPTTPSPTPGSDGSSDRLPQPKQPGDAQADRTRETGDQIGAMARKAAIQVLNQHMDQIINLAATIPFDGKFQAGELTSMLANSPLARALDPKTLAMLQNVQSIEKHGNHIEITQKGDMRFPLNVNENGAVIDDIKIGHKLSFDISRDANGHNQFANVSGIDVEGHTKGLGPLNREFDAPLETVTIDKDAHGNTVFNAQLKNPERWYEKLGEKWLKGIDRGDHIQASIELNNDGTVCISEPGSPNKRRIA